MHGLPRLAVGTIQSGVDAVAVLWGLMDVLAERGVDSQHFLSRGCFVPLHGSPPGGGRSVRYLDSWLMAPDICRELFVHGSRTCDLALVEGHFSPTGGDTAEGDGTAARDGTAEEQPGGNLDALCEWLGLPRVVVLDVGRLDDCRLPTPPVGTRALILDGLPAARDFVRWQTRLESLWNIPVVGALPRCEHLRPAVHQLSGEAPPRALARELGRALADFLRLDRLLALAAERECDWPATNRLRAGAYLDDMVVAVAYDELFNCYFPDTLDLLELQGATLTTFSPLRDDRLPAEADVVYFGCGHPERAPAELGANRCLISSLAEHVFGGGRVYAEGGGLAYLCQEMIDEQGRPWPMAGILPAAARLAGQPPAPRPVEVTLAQGNWLGEGWSQLRGYVSGRWDVEPRGPLRRYAAQAGHELDLIGVQNAIASRIHLNFAAQPEFLQAFFVPHRLAAGEAV